MQVENNNYNTLGRLGPLYPRPEYRPKNNAETGAERGGAKEEAGQREGLKLTLGQKSFKKAEAIKANRDERLTLSMAKSLTEETAQAITLLPPDGRRHAPHVTGPNMGLLIPTYV
ncbi:MAG: hypothetical protein LBV23_11680 [Deltaproteobacteria bacterium]|jgi:hypothetical protein|nr:hypothetical protein [Deltaproteobacteria bacterium]